MAAALPGCNGGVTAVPVVRAVPVVVAALVPDVVAAPVPTALGPAEAPGGPSVEHAGASRARESNNVFQWRIDMIEGGPSC